MGRRPVPIEAVFIILAQVKVHKDKSGTERQGSKRSMGESEKKQE